MLESEGGRSVFLGEFVKSKLDMANEAARNFPKMLDDNNIEGGTRMAAGGFFDILLDGRFSGGRSGLLVDQLRKILDSGYVTGDDGGTLKEVIDFGPIIDGRVMSYRAFMLKMDEIKGVSDRLCERLLKGDRVNKVDEVDGDITEDNYEITREEAALLRLEIQYVYGVMGDDPKKAVEDLNKRLSVISGDGGFRKLTDVVLDGEEDTSIG